MRHKQSLTQSLIVVIVGSYLISQYVYPGLQDQFVLYGPAVKAGQYWRLFTVALLHANWIHLLFNMLALWSIGTPVEQIFGRGRYATIFLGSLLTASIASAYFGPAALSVGASGAIFGLFGALLAVGKKAGINYQNIVGTVVLNLGITFLVPGIDWHAHVGGLIGGYLIAQALILSKRT
jgi:membrane associated rhomboid family serine protease